MQFALALKYYLDSKLVSKYMVGRYVQKHSSSWMLFFKVEGPIYLYGIQSGIYSYQTQKVVGPLCDARHTDYYFCTSTFADGSYF